MVSGEVDSAQQAAGISCSALSVTIAGRRVLDDVTLQVAPGSWLAVIGPNGAGKTTLLRALAALVTASGTVTAAGRDLGGLRPRERARLVAYVPQHPVVPLGFSVVDYVLLGRTAHLRPLGAEGPADVALAGEVLAELDLDAYAGRMLSSLSGGERQRAVLARALCQEAPVLLLDEPTTGLDIGYQQEVLDHLERLRASRGCSIVSAMHDLTLAAAYADEVAILRNGGLVATGRPEETITEQHLAAFGEARVRLIDLDGTIAVVPVREQRPARRDGP